MRNTLRLSATAAFAASLLFGVTGCTYVYKFEMAGVVRAPDGTPLPGVKVVLQGELLHSGFPVVTGPDGRFSANFNVSESTFKEHKPLPVWSFTLSKDGYRTAAIDIRLKEKPESAGTTTHISVEWVLVAEQPAGAVPQE